MTYSQIYFAATLLIGLGVYLIRRALLSPQSHKDDDKALADRDLSPTEVAYITKNGDDGFALLVLLFDIMHREVKDKISGGEVETYDLNQRPYELTLKRAAGGSLKAWSARKIEAVAGSPRKDPVKFVRQLPALYKFSRSVVEGTIKDLFRDPRNIKKFISVAGLMRLAADIGATGFKATLAQELRETLTNEGFIATPALKDKCRNYLVVTFIAAEISLLVMTLYTIPVPFHAWLIFGSALFAAFVVRITLAAREFIPLYSELAEALALVQNKNLRVNIIRTLLNIFTTLLNIASALIFVVLLGSAALLLYLTGTVTNFDTYLMLVALMLVQLLAFSCLVEAYRLTLGEMPTRAARQSIARLRQKYKHEAALPALKAMLSQNDYGPELSFLIALYGLESLLLI